MEHGMTGLATDSSMFTTASVTLATFRVPACDPNLLISSDYLTLSPDSSPEKSSQWKGHLFTRCPALICQGSVGE
jgi:hypothetical protein